MENERNSGRTTNSCLHALKHLSLGRTVHMKDHSGIFEESMTLFNKIKNILDFYNLKFSYNLSKESQFHFSIVLNGDNNDQYMLNFQDYVVEHILPIIGNDNNQTSKTMENKEQKQLTFGEKAAGVSFNPGGHPEVNVIKRMAADFIDHCNEARNNATSPDAKRYYSTAITEMEKAQMLAVKAATWQH